MINKKKSIIVVNEATGERKDFKSINTTAMFLGVNFQRVAVTALHNGVIKGWRLFESPEVIRMHIEDLQKQLDILENHV